MELQCRPTHFLCSHPHQSQIHSIASKPTIPTPTPTIIPISSPATHLTVRRISTNPILPRIRTSNRIIIAALRNHLKHIRQVGIHFQNLRVTVEALLANLSNRRSLCIIDNNIKSIVCSNTILVALILLDVNGAPAWCITG